MKEKLSKRNTIIGKFVRMIIAVNVMMIFLLYVGYGTANKMSSMEDSTRYLSRFKIFCLIVVIVFTIVLTCIFRSILRSIREGFATVIDVTRQMANGKLDINLNLEQNDEFGDLYREYDKLIIASKKQAELAQRVANSDLSVEIVPRSEEDVLGKALKQMVSETSQSMYEISKVAETVYAGAERMTNDSHNLAQGSTEQASTIQEITASIAEVTEETKVNAKRANEASELIEKALQSVHEGNEQMNEMMSAMKGIDESSQNIARIMKVIDDIAFQTNILALNAAVEAARAGSAGKGFAVVAEEVRNLAAKSAEAAAETADLIEQAIKKTEEGSSIADITASKFETITESVNHSAQIVINIAENSHNQAMTLEQIDVAVEQVSQVVQNNSSISESCAEESNNLSDKAKEMQMLIQKYKFK